MSQKMSFIYKATFNMNIFILKIFQKRRHLVEMIKIANVWKDEALALIAPDCNVAEDHSPQPYANVCLGIKRP